MKKDSNGKIARLTVGHLLSVLSKFPNKNTPVCFVKSQTADGEGDCFSIVGIGGIDGNLTDPKKIFCKLITYSYQHKSHGGTIAANAYVKGVLAGVLDSCRWAGMDAPKLSLTQE